MCGSNNSYKLGSSVEFTGWVILIALILATIIQDHNFAREIYNWLYIMFKTFKFVKPVEKNHPSTPLREATSLFFGPEKSARFSYDLSARF